MALRIVLRAAVRPLLPEHVLCTYTTELGSGMHGADVPTHPQNYVDGLVTRASEKIASDELYQSLIKGLVYGPTKKAIARLTPRNQFMALSKAVSICDRPQTLEGHPLQSLYGCPFVLTLLDLPLLEAARLTDEDPVTSELRLLGFVEQHLGTVCGLFIE